jgi:ribosomal protein S18 acetylase RimI-like enzyme
VSGPAKPATTTATTTATKPVGVPRVRRARPTDWASARTLLREIDELHATIAPDYFRNSARSEPDWLRLIDDPYAAVFVAELAPAAPDDRIVGVLVARVYDTPADPAMVPRRRGHIETLVVAARHRRRGIGRLLMAESTAWARAEGAIEIVLTTWAGNQEAEAFYERLGYRLLSRVLHARLD